MHGMAFFRDGGTLSIDLSHVLVDPVTRGRGRDSMNRDGHPPR